MSIKNNGRGLIMYDSSYKTKILISLGILLFGIIGLIYGDREAVSIFLIVIGMLGFLVILLDYIAELKNGKKKP